MINRRSSLKRGIAGSSPSKPIMALKSVTTSATERPIGPTVSSVDEIGTTPDLLKDPVVGFKPTRELALEGDKMEPEVSDPTATAA